MTTAHVELCCADGLRLFAFNPAFVSQFWNSVRTIAEEFSKESDLADGPRATSDWV